MQDRGVQIVNVHLVLYGRVAEVVGRSVGLPPLDAAASHPDLNLTIPDKPNAPVILMDHEPDYVETVLQHPRGPFVDIMLSGHTHGGQIRLPVGGALVLPPMGQKFIEGYFRLDHLQLYVNRGVGTVGLPFRLNCPPELTMFTLQPA